MLSHNPNNYHWSEYNISEWSHKYLMNRIEEILGECKEFNIKAHITQRMGKVGIIYFINGLIEKEKDRIKLYEYDNYSSLEDIITNREELKYKFIKIIEEYEKEAIKKYSFKVLEGLPEGEEEEITPIKENSNNFEVIISASKSDIINFFIQKHLLCMWRPHNLTLENIKFNAVEDILSFKFKIKEWKDYSMVEITLIKNGIKIEQKNIDEKNNIKEIWNNYIFIPLSKCFRITYNIK